MDSSNILSQLEQLDDEIDDLEESLEPLLKTAFSETTSKLPLLDKAKLYVLVTYAIESTLFSYLRLHGVQAREHPVFTELTRVKQYFAKVKNAEEPASKLPPMSLDKAAAGRFIKAGLSGNDKFDLEKAERIAKEKAKAHIRFTELSKKRKAEDEEDENNEEAEEEEDSEAESEAEVITGGGAEKSPVEEEEEISLLVSEEETPKSRKKEKTKNKTKAQKTEKEKKKEAKKQARLAAGLPEKKRESHAAKKARKAEKKNKAAAGV